MSDNTDLHTFRDKKLVFDFFLSVTLKQGTVTIGVGKHVLFQKALLSLGIESVVIVGPDGIPSIIFPGNGIHEIRVAELAHSCGWDKEVSSDNCRYINDKFCLYLNSRIEDVEQDEYE